MLCIIIILASMAMGCSSQAFGSDYSVMQYGAESSDTSLLVIKQGNLYGFCDANGKVVIKPQFQEAKPFYDGLSVVMYENLYGYIDKSGKVVIPFRYVKALNFNNGKSFAATEYIVKDNQKVPKYCIIDKSGAIEKETNYTDVVDFSDGIACAHSGEVPLLVNNNYNEIELDSKYYQLYTNLTQFHDGYALIGDINGENSYINYAGKIMFDKVYCNAKPFSGGYAAVKIDFGSCWGYIDQTGVLKIQPAFKEASPFGEKMACVEMSDGTWNIINSDGQIIHAIQANAPIEKTGAFSEGLCSILTFHGDIGYWGYIDASGRVVIGCKFSEVTPFINGIAEVKLSNGKIGYIGKTGSYIWKPK